MNSLQYIGITIALALTPAICIWCLSCLPKKFIEKFQNKPSLALLFISAIMILIVAYFILTTRT